MVPLVRLVLSLEPGWSKRNCKHRERICNRGHLHNLPVDSAIKLANHRRRSRQSDDTTRGKGEGRNIRRHRHHQAKSPQKLDLDRRAAEDRESRNASGQLICQPMCRGLKLGLKPKGCTPTPSLPPFLPDVTSSVPSRRPPSVSGEETGNGRCCKIK